MHIIKNLDNLILDNTVVCIGNFDGVHAGHQKIISKVIERAKKNIMQSVVCTYSPNTKVFLGKIKNEDLLMTEEEKYQALRELGVDRCVVFNFDDTFKNQTAEEFVKKYLVGKIGMREFVVGYDTNFGSDRKGDKDHLEILGKKYNFTITAVEPLIVEGEIVSSTQIRKSV